MNIYSRTWKVDASSADKLDILKMNVEPGFKQVNHKKKNLEPVNEETLEKIDKIKCTRLYFAGKGIVLPVTVNDIEANGVVDTGADATVISSDFDTKGWKKACLLLLNAEDGALRRSKLAVIPQVGPSM